jgi:UDP-N-acetylglucosamine 2-epimerase (non-hydrolysing)
MLQVSAVVGARPNFIKMAALMRAARKRGRFQIRLIHTGQHYSQEMSDVFFQGLEMPTPSAYLGISTGSHAMQTAEIMRKIEPELVEHRPDLVIVVGDVNSTLAAALAASKLNLPIAHIEAGLRSFDREMPEEVNRLVTDVLSDHLFASEPSAMRNLAREGIAKEKTFLVGSILIDTLREILPKAAHSRILEELGLVPKRYAVVTLHRPSNVDDRAQREPLMEMLVELAKSIPVVFPAHPRTRARLERPHYPGVHFTPPMGYREFLRLTSQARLVLTDSGGIQEETTVMQVPCLTIRDTTERPITVEQGTNTLVGTGPHTILQAARKTLAADPRPSAIPEFWDGHTSERILDVLEARLYGSELAAWAQVNERGRVPIQTGFALET